MIALKAILEKLTCQKETARKKLDSKAIIVEFFFWINISLVNKYMPRMVRVPIIADGNLSDHKLTPKR